MVNPQTDVALRHPHGASSRGHEAGHKWARTQAGAAEIGRLRQFIGGLGDNYLRHLKHATPSSFRAADYLAFSVMGLERNEYSYIGADDFWNQVLSGDRSDETRSDEFLCGFIEGALEVQHVVTDYGAATLEIEPPDAG